LTTSGRLRISARDLARIGLLYLSGGCWGGEKLLDPDLADLVTTSPHPSDLPRTQQEQAEMLARQRSMGSGKNLEAHLNSYSYCWWLNGVTDEGERVFPDAPADTYGAFGHGGRHAMVIMPGRDLVVSWVIGLGNRQPWRFSVDGRERVNRALKLVLDAAPKIECAAHTESIR